MIARRIALDAWPRSLDLARMSRALTLLLRALRDDSPPTSGRITGECWLEILQLADVHGVSMLLWRKWSWLETAPQGVVMTLSSRIREHALRSLAMAHELRQLTDLLAEAGIPTIPLKGPVLSWRLYQDFGLRVSRDLDVLIPRELVVEAGRVLCAAGYRSEFPLSGATGRAYLRNYHDYSLWTPRGQLVELHWQWAQRRLAIPLKEHEWWSESRPVQTPLGKMRVLSADHEFLFLCIHVAKHAWAQLDLILDLVALGEKETIDWKRVSQTADALGLRRMVTVTVALVRQLGSSLSVPFPIDTAARSILDQVQQSWATPAQSTTAARLWFDLSLRERRRDRLRMLMRTMFTSTPADWSALRLPDRWFALYGVVRLLRLSGAWRRERSDIVDQSMRGVGQLTELPTHPDAADRQAVGDAAIGVELPSKT